MQVTKQRSIALGTAAAMLFTTFSGLNTPPARAGSKLWRDLAIGAGVVTGYGLLKHRRSTAVIGGIATGLAYYKYRQERKHEEHRRSVSYYSYPSYSSSYYYGRTHHYYSYPTYGSSYYYGSSYPSYSVSPYRYTRPYYYRTHHYYRHVYPYHAYLHRAAYAYHPALHRAAYPYHPALHQAVYPYHAELHQAAYPYHAALHQPAVQPVSSTHVVPATATLAATSRPAQPAATGFFANTGMSPLSFGIGFLAALVALGAGLALANSRRRAASTVGGDYPRFNRTQGGTI